MKRKIFDRFIIILCIFILVELLIKKEIVYESIIYALNIWVNKLIPALFPFFIISDILINYNITMYIPNSIKYFFRKIFNITDNMLTIFLLSLISGFPSNARNTRILYDKGEITKDEANHILIFSHFSNPVFILITVGFFFLGDIKIGIIIMISHYLSNFIIGLFFRKMFVHNENIEKKIDIKNSFGSIFIKAIHKGIDSCILICGIVVVFLLLASIICNIFNFNSYINMIIKGIFEITIGIDSLSSLNIILRYKVIISSLILSFGGLSVHVQVLSQITDTDIEYKYFLIGRIWQSLVTIILSLVICLILNI